MKVNVYTREDKIQKIELELETAEYFIIQKALLNFTVNTNEPMEDRILAVMMTESIKQKEQIELEICN